MKRQGNTKIINTKIRQVLAIDAGLIIYLEKFNSKNILLALRQ